MKAIKTLLTTAIVFATIAVSNIKVNANELALTIYAENKAYYYSVAETGMRGGRRYLKCCEGVVEGIYYDTLIPPINASVAFSGGKNPTFTYTSEKMGKGVDKNLLLKKIDYALNNGKVEVEISLNEIKPQITTDMLKNCSYLRGCFETDYSSSTSSRKHNVELATSKINGIILEKGEVFSFNDVVGARTEKAGFKNAVVIENGEYTEGVGGGVCQVSTTIYNCALLSGLKTTERHPHTLLPSYVQPSFDAMVAFNSCDLKFVNDTGGWVFISSYFDGNKIGFKMYGEKPLFTYKLKHEIVSETPPPAPDVIYNTEMFEGEIKTLKVPKSQVKSRAFVVKLKGDSVFSNTLLHTDVYQSVQGKLEVGVKQRQSEQTSRFYLTKRPFNYKMLI